MDTVSVHQYCSTATSKQRAQVQGFKCFNRLPIELHLIIYALSSPLPRIAINIKKGIDHGDYFDVFTGYQPRSFEIETTGSIPSLLHVSQEARSFALEYYSLLELSSHRKFYFDFKRDVLRITDMDYDDIQDLISPVRLKQFKSVRNVILTPEREICQLHVSRSMSGDIYIPQMSINLPDFEGVRNVWIYDDSSRLTYNMEQWHTALREGGNPDLVRLNGRDFWKESGVFEARVIGDEVETWVEALKGVV